MDKKYVIISLLYALTGLILGTIMAATKNHGHMVTHAHIMLLGFVTSFIYAVCYKLWITNGATKIALLQFLLHQLGTLLLLTGLFLMYAQIVPGDKLAPMMASSSIAIILSLILMIYQLIFQKKRN